MAVLALGSRGLEVKRLQVLLRSKLVPPRKIVVDGDFGAKTDDAVKYFQRQKGMKVDGVVGYQTWAALGQRSGPASAPPTSPTPTTPVLLTSSKRKYWMEIAKAELGVSENHLPGQDTARIVEYHKATTLDAQWAERDETPWCSSFVNWVMNEAGYTGTRNALARSWINWGTAQDPPSYGAVTVIKKKNASSDKATGSSTGFHVAFFISKSPTHIRLLGGNQGDRVQYSNFNLGAYEVKAYRVP